MAKATRVPKTKSTDEVSSRPLPPSIEKFEVQKLPRSALKKADYNPRTLTDKARKKLAKGIEKLGLLAPITYNKRTGNIVGGHQRLTVMDSYYGTDQYELNVAVVDLSEKEEKEANILLNNYEAQGEWDLDKLNGMLAEGLDLDAAGFDPADVFRLFGDSAKVDASAAEVFADRVRDSMKTTQDIFSKAKASGQTDFYVVFVFPNVEKRDAFLTKHGFDDNRFQSGAELDELLQQGAQSREHVDGLDAPKT
jgi:hypothetical protein